VVFRSQSFDYSSTRKNITLVLDYLFLNLDYIYMILLSKFLNKEVKLCNSYNAGKYNSLQLHLVDRRGIWNSVISLNSSNKISLKLIIVVVFIFVELVVY